MTENLQGFTMVSTKTSAENDPRLFPHLGVCGEVHGQWAIWLYKKMILDEGSVTFFPSSLDHNLQI